MTKLFIDASVLVEKNIAKKIERAGLKRVVPLYVNSLVTDPIEGYDLAAPEESAA